MTIQTTLALRYLSGRKLRTFLTTLAIVFGVLLVFGMNTVMPAFLSSFAANAMAAAGQVDATVTSKTGDSFPESIADLEWRGEIVGTMPFKTTAVQMLRFDRGTQAGGDPRKHGAAKVE